ncbi:uridine diphosphate glucose pyrophosphatase NUDT22 [Oryzias melastigma]|uniref:Nudix (nucleoside diphosphate linked moiety X)-type motif 22 n=1 Tax=Oryzias melastigma TaxID=30732 RepID=A0A3B3DT62_ORYME|nr:uridine diphosphate glucose pyrophosphatase NUDT22 [Oryzias melastigma]
MDPEVSVLFHCAPWRGLRDSQVGVEVSERYNRKSDSALERHISEVWTERLSKEPWLFNGAKFRLHSFILVSPNHQPSTYSSHAPPEHSLEGVGDGDALLDHSDQRNRLPKTENNDVKQHSTGLISIVSPTNEDRKSKGGAAEHGSEPILVLRLGLTSYKEYLGTNWSCDAAELRQRGQAEFKDPLALLAQPLGVGAILCTSDDQVVFIRRSQKVAEAGGLLDIPGGHPEPKAVCESLGETVSEEQITMVMMQRRPAAVVSELFFSVSAEIRDEVNVALRFLGAPVLLGVALNHTSAGRPSAEFFVSCSLTSKEIQELYWKGGAEANESTDVVFLSRAEVLQLNSSSPLWSELCPSAKGAVLLYQTVKPGRADDTTQQAHT